MIYTIVVTVLAMLSTWIFGVTRGRDRVDPGDDREAIRRAERRIARL